MSFLGSLGSLVSRLSQGPFSMMVTTPESEDIIHEKYALIVIDTHGSIQDVTKPQKTAPINICIRHYAEIGCVAYAGLSKQQLKNHLTQRTKFKNPSETTPSLTEQFQSTILSIEEKYLRDTAIDYHKDVVAIKKSTTTVPPHELIRNPDHIAPFIGCLNSKYFEKEYAATGDLAVGKSAEADPGIFVGANNIGIERNTKIILDSQHQRCTLTYIINYFTALGVEHLFIVDYACAVFDSKVSASQQGRFIEKAEESALFSSDERLPPRKCSIQSYLIATIARPPLFKKHIYWQIPKKDSDNNIIDIYIDSWDGTEKKLEDITGTFHNIWRTLTFDNSKILIEKTEWIKLQDTRKYRTTLFFRNRDDRASPNYYEVGFNPANYNYTVRSATPPTMTYTCGFRSADRVPYDEDMERLLLEDSDDRISEDASPAYARAAYARAAYSSAPYSSTVPSTCGIRGCHGRNKTGKYCGVSSSGNRYCKKHLEEDTQSSVGSGRGSYARTPDVQAQPRSTSSVTRGNKPKCKCARSQSEPTIPCPNPAVNNGFCGKHQKCKFILGGGRKKTQKNRKF